MVRTYKIGEAATLLKLKTYVLRFWESEFPDIEPLRTESGRRLYTEDTLALLERIRFLLHDRGLTIGGARRILAEEKARGVRYVAGVTGAVADAGALPEDDIAGPGAFFSSAGGNGAPEHDDESEPETDDASARFLGASPFFRPDGNRSGQLNLPGLETLLPLLAGMLRNAGAAVPSPDRNNEPAARNAERMLPLFAAVRKGERSPDAGAFFGKAAGTVVAVPDAPAGRIAADRPVPPVAGVPAGFRQDVSGSGPEPGEKHLLRDIVSELEHLALMLRNGGRS
jgi:DNA-binding transcriptional MerR regulator